MVNVHDVAGVGEPGVALLGGCHRLRNVYPSIWLTRAYPSYAITGLEQWLWVKAMEGARTLPTYRVEAVGHRPGARPWATRLTATGRMYYDSFELATSIARRPVALGCCTHLPSW